jgi:hypothetical protein
MRPISAADAVSVAVQRTRDFFFRPFSWANYLKLGLVAIITEGIGSNLRSGSHGGSPSGHVPTDLSPFNVPAVWIAAGVAMVLLIVVFSLVVLYLVTRLRFAFFHCLIHNSKQIRPGWYLYQSQASRFFWMNVAVGFGFLLVVVLAALPFISGFMRLFHETQQGGPFDLRLMLTLLLPLIPVILILTLAGVLTDVVLRDWMLPHYALDDATAGEAWSAVWAHVMAEKRQFIVYALLRLILPTIAVIALFFVLMIPGLVLGASVAVVEWGIHSIFADSTGASAVVGVLLQIFFGVLAFVFALLGGICVGGPVATAIREYALVFYGGRYRALGDILYPSAPPPFGSDQLSY